MRRTLPALRGIFLIIVLVFIIAAAASAGFSHDENQFIAAGQLLVDHGQLPYLDYPYTHMPYAAAFYAISAALSPFDFLAARLLNAVAWWLSIALLLSIFRRLAGKAAGPGWMLAWEAAVVFLLLTDPVLERVLGNALNHSFAALFSLAALWMFLRAIETTEAARRFAAWSGALGCIAAVTRFNYAVVLIILALLLAAWGWLKRPRDLGPVGSFGIGALIAAIPAIVLAAAAPYGFLYTNFVYIKLNTIYYGELLYQANMQLGQKLLGFGAYLLATPVDLTLYLLLLIVTVRALVRYRRSRGTPDLAWIAVCGCALGLAATAFAPSPTQIQYFLAPLPFMLIILLGLGAEAAERSKLSLGVVAAALVVLQIGTVDLGRSAAALRAVTRPAEWVPVQGHALAEEIRTATVPGRVLTLMPMFALEAGREIYPFAANGPFSWRTSLLLTADRRARYSVASPQELPEILAQDPPVAILTGFESTNAGFERSDLGGLETPFVDYAKEHGFTAMPLETPFLEQKITLWVRAP